MTRKPAWNPLLRGLALAAGCALALAGSAVAAPAKTPDFTGVFMIQPAYFLGKPLLPAPKLTPEVQALNARRSAAGAAGYVREANGMLCGQNGGPNMFQIRSPFEIFTGFGRVTLIFETEMNNQPRTIYLDQKTQPEEIYPSFNGHSIGHWEGQTLVVDTIGFIGRGHLIGPIPRTPTTHLTERFSWAPDGKSLSIRMTVEDPASLIEPWSTTLAFDRKPTTEERFEVWCDADLEAYSRLNLEALKDADPEIALRLGGAFSDPAIAIDKAAKAAGQ